MDKETPLWRAEYGDCGDAIVSIENEGGRVLLGLKNN
jgi:hypothetical protein